MCASLLASILVLNAGSVSAQRSPARLTDSEADLLARIEREQDAVKKAKYEIRLGRVKLRAATDAYGQGDFEKGEQQLKAYLDEMQISWSTLQQTGRKAERKSQGFKELDIALRQDARTLDDLTHRLPVSDRAPVENVAQEVEKVRAEVLHALFPPEGPKKKKRRFFGKEKPESVEGGPPA